MKQSKCIFHMRKPIAALVLFAILFALLSSHSVATAAPTVQLPPCCVDEFVALEELPCCEIPEVNGCCFILYPPPICAGYFTPVTVANMVCVGLLYDRNTCRFIFEPPKM